MRVGLFVRNLDEEYQINVYRGVFDRARRLGIEVLCAQGETIPLVPGALRPFQTAHEMRLDGILVLAPVIIDEGDGTRVASIPSFLPPVPAVAIGFRVPGMPSVVPRPAKALTALATHLVEDHGYRRILFVGGPVRHPDGIARKKEFLQAMGNLAQQHPDLSWEVCHGGFYEASGVESLTPYLNGQPFDAVMAANDTMAIGIQRVLEAHEKRGWRRCAVTGFDDISQAQAADPPLTTVRAPIAALGALALDKLVDLIEGRPERTWSVSACEPVFRRSCGCLISRPDLAAVAPISREALEDQLDVSRRRMLDTERWIREINGFGRQMGSVGDRKTLLDSLDWLLSVLNVDKFLLLIDGVLWYERQDRIRVPLPLAGVPMSLPEAVDRHSGTGSSTALFHLVSELQVLGTAVYSLGGNSLYHIATALPHVTNAVHRIRDREVHVERNRQLEHLVQDRTRDLMRTNEELREEVRRRRAAEAEILQISEMERQRFGLDLHDDICQRLAGVGMYIRGGINQPPTDCVGFLKDVGDLVEETLQLTRQYAHASFPIELETRGLDSVLRHLCETASRQRGLPCTYVSDLAALATPPQGLAALNLFRIVQEAVQNAVKHAEASAITVSLRANDGWVVLRVSDDGKGIKGKLSDIQGFGLRSMIYRASQLGGKLDVRHRASGGTVVEALVPDDWNKVGG